MTENEHVPLTEELVREAREEALDFLEGLLEVMQLEGEVEVQASVEEGLVAEVAGEDLGILIGRRGQTLEGIQDLLRTAVQRQIRTRMFIALDIEGYQHRRREALEELAREMAERAQTEGEVELDPMSAFERKVVHDTVAAIEGLTSFSEGEEPTRRVIIQSEARLGNGHQRPAEEGEPGEEMPASSQPVSETEEPAE